MQQEVFYMNRKWTDIQKLEPEILRMRKDGRTRQEIADAMGLEKEQIKNWVKRYNRRINNPVLMTKRKGRPRTRSLSEPEAMAVRVRELEREVDLYRSFLQAVGRR
jgi:transposase